MAALSCGLIAVGSCNADVSSTIIQKMMEWPASELKDTYTRYLSLGLALTYLGKCLLFIEFLSFHVITYFVLGMMNYIWLQGLWSRY